MKCFEQWKIDIGKIKHSSINKSIDRRAAPIFDTKRSEGQRDVSGEHDGVHKMSKSGEVCKVKVVEVWE